MALSRRFKGETVIFVKLQFRHPAANLWVEAVVEVNGAESAEELPARGELPCRSPGLW